MQQKRIHPTLEKIQEFLNDALTEQEFLTRNGAVLNLINQDLILEAAEQIKAQRVPAEQPAEEDPSVN